MTKYYELGDRTEIESPRTNAILRGKDAIIALYSKAAWDKIYKSLCDEIREKYGFNYLILLVPHTRDNKSILIIVFEYEVTNTLFTNYHLKPNDQCYIEVEDE